MNPALQPLAANAEAPHPPQRFFIADLHLDGRDTERALHFRKFLEHLAARAGSGPVNLYILGDLFEFWYEYRAPIFAIYDADLRALENAWQAGVKIFLIFGNRDFAYGRYVNQRFGATVLGDGQQITLADTRRAWLEHGDLLCTADRSYLRFRAVIRSGPVRFLFWLMPWSIARRGIERIRNRATADKRSKPAKMLEIDPAAAERRLAATHSQLLLCGHTHRPQALDLSAGKRLLVLPPWCDTPAGYLDDGRSLRPFTLEELLAPPVQKRR